MHDRLIVVMGKLVPYLQDMPKSDRWADYFGQAYCVLARECYMAMSTGNESLFRKIFPPFFQAGLFAFNDMIEETSGQRRDTAVAYITDPYADILELSGYAIIYSELDGKNFKDIVVEVWNRFISAYPDKKPIMGLLSSLHDTRTSMLMLTAREMERGSWKNDFERRMVERGLIDDRYPRSVRRRREEKPYHPSPVIRALMQEGLFLPGEALQVFLAVYLMNHPDAAGQAFSRQTKRLAQLIQEEEAKGTKE